MSSWKGHPTGSHRCDGRCKDGPEVFVLSVEQYRFLPSGLQRGLDALLAEIGYPVTEHLIYRLMFVGDRVWIFEYAQNDGGFAYLDPDSPGEIARAEAVCVKLP
jgi:hypothetical protein